MSTAVAAKVLVVDDDPLVLGVVKTILKRGGLEVLTASGGEQALRIVESQSDSIDLVLADVCMPNMDGFELAKKIREIAPSTRVAFMSGILGSKQIEQGVPFIRKPFEAGTLVARVRALLPRGVDPAD